MTKRETLKRTNRLKKIEDDPRITHCYIRKSGYYYRPKHCGYTEYQTDAGVYTKEVALSEARFCGEVDIIPIDVRMHNFEINRKIDDLKTRLIPAGLSIAETEKKEG